MSRKRVAGVTSSAMLSMAMAMGCSGATGPSENDAIAGTEDALGSAGQTCPSNRAVWYSSNNAVPLATVNGVGGKWASARLFAGTASPELARYWSFTWSPSTNAAPDFTTLTGYTAKLGKDVPQRDCPAVVGLSSISDATAVWTSLRAKGWDRTARLAQLPAGSASTVRVAVVDSAARSYASTLTDTLGHGRAVGRAVRDLACPADAATTGAQCLGEVENYAALVHLTPTSTNPVAGGYYGTQSELAQAIVGATDDWVKAATATRLAHLVVNLSVGWDSAQGYGGEYAVPADLPGAARAVHAAVRHAVCRGGLVVAAAGNRSGLASSGPMFPAQWETHAAPTADECAVLEGTRTLPADTATYRPLVYAAGALDAIDRPIASTRLNGRPRLAAYGSNVVSGDPRAVHTDILTGTSMAAATVSGIAAAVWAYRPTATANEVMNLVYSSGVDLGVAPDFRLGTAAGSVRRVSHCGALRAATNGTFRCPTPAANTGSTVLFDSSWTNVDPGFSAPPMAATEIFQADLPIAASAVSTPWVTPQPGSPGCDVCGFSSLGKLYLHIYPATPWGYHITQAVVTVKRSYVLPGQSWYRYFTYYPPSSGDVSYSVSGITGGSYASASVTFYVAGYYGTYQTTSPVLIGL